MNELDDFVTATKKVETRCITCKIDPKLLQIIKDGREKEPTPVPYRMISQWLKQKHAIAISESAIRAHVEMGHQWETTNS